MREEKNMEEKKLSAGEIAGIIATKEALEKIGKGISSMLRLFVNPWGYPARLPTSITTRRGKGGLRRSRG